MDMELKINEFISSEFQLFLQEPLEVQYIIKNYMTKKCTININEQTNSHLLVCDNYHNESQRRRTPFINGELVYKSEVCVFNSAFCKNYENCGKCHNNLEFCFHPEKFRTTSCNLLNCYKFGKICPFSHSVDTLRNSYSFTNNNLNIINNKYNNVQLNRDSKILPKLGNLPSAKINYYHINDEISKTGLKETDLFHFKIYPCNIYVKHNEKQCMFYHSAKDFKRILSKFYYSFEFCKFAEAGRKCPNGEFCQKSHNRVEQFYHPEKFKSKFCSHYNNLNNCPYGKFCSFAHRETEMNVELIHKYEQNEDFFIFYFKSTWCPFNHSHDKSSCVYAHNWQDYRRSPSQYHYSENICYSWDNKKTILNYNEGCENEYRCNNCHGWKEQDYHPFVYKTKMCKYLLAFCNKANFCPFYHKEESQRVVNQIEKEKLIRKIDLKIPLNIVLVNTKSEQFNKSDLLNQQRNSINSIDYNPYFNNSCTILNLQRKSTFENHNSSLAFNAILLNQNISYSTLNEKSTTLNERSSIFSNDSLKLGNTKKNSISSTPNNNSKNRSNLSKDQAKNFARFSSLHFEYNPEEKLFDIEDVNSDSMSGNSSFEENLDSSGDLTKLMRRDEKINTNSIISNFDALSQSDFSKFKDVPNKKNNDLSTILNLKDNDTSFQVKENFQSQKKYRKQLLEYLKINGFLILYRKILKKDISTQELLILEDEDICKFVEQENRQRVANLKKFINELDDAHDYEDLLKKIDDDILKGNKLFK